VRRLALQPLLLVVALLALPGSALAQTAPSPLPNGASSLQETYEDWRVACVVAEAGKLCALSQQQARQDGQRVLAIELVPQPEGPVTGSLVLPFGLSLDAGAVLQIDDQEPRPALRFSTCLPVGCIVPVSFDEALLAALREGGALKLHVTPIDAAQPLTLSISLKGFAAALERTRVLAE
jgi:invasion protein IalB